MERWISAAFLLKTSATLAQLTRSRKDSKEVKDPTSDPQSSGLRFMNTDGSEERARFINGGGNIIRNPCFEDGLTGWSGGGCKLVLNSSVGEGKVTPLHGYSFASATDRRESWNSIQQDVSGRVRRKIPYEVAAIVRILGDVSSKVSACLWVQSPSGREEYISIASVQASEKEWVTLKGKFLLNGVASKAVIHVAGPPMGTDILVNGLVVKHAKKFPPSPPLDVKNVLYGVNIIENSNLNQGLNGWSPLGSCILKVCTDSPNVLPKSAKDCLLHPHQLSNRYILATNRTETWMGPSQTITNKLDLYLTYQIAAWVRVGPGAGGPQIINVTLRVDDRWIGCGQVQAIDDAWYEIRGSFRLEKQPSKAIVYIGGPSRGVDLMVAGFNMFPVDRKACFDHLKEKTDKIRKRDIILKFPGLDRKNVAGASVKVRQIKNSFPFGLHINRSLIENEDFVSLLLNNFNWAVFGNELKWYATEPEQGRYNYNDADVLLDFCDRHGIETRGHCIFWEVEDTVQPWIRSLNRSDLMSAIDNRLKGLLSRYNGRFRHYDVNNEMLHGSFYKDRLGEDIRAYMFREAHRLDPSATLFVNDYNIESGCDSKSTPEMYVNQILDLQERGARVGGIGLQGHMSNPNGEILCDALDKLGILGIPIWLTELDVSASNEHVRADDLEVILREAYAHPSVEGIVLWGHLECMCRENSHLIDADGDANEAGKRFLALKKEWMSNADGDVDAFGEFRFRGYHGMYNVEVTTPWKKSSQSFIVEKGESPLVLAIKL